MELNYYYHKFNVRVASRLVSRPVSQLKTYNLRKWRSFSKNSKKKKTRRHSLMPSPRSKNKRLAMVQENWTKSAIKLSIKVLIYLIRILVSTYFLRDCRWDEFILMYLVLKSEIYQSVGISLRWAIPLRWNKFNFIRTTVLQNTHLWLLLPPSYMLDVLK